VNTRYLILLFLTVILVGCNPIETTGQLKEEYEFKKYLKRAENGDVKAQLLVADMYEWGQTGLSTTDNNIKEAAKWYEKAAMLGNVEAQSKLGKLYTFAGENITDNNDAQEKGLYWTQKAAINGSADAQESMAMNYSENEFEAFKWYEKAAQQDYKRAQVSTAYNYLLGRGVEEDRYEAFLWFEKAAQTDEKYLIDPEFHEKNFGKRDAKIFEYGLDKIGDGSAAIQVVKMLYEGDGAPQDYSRAFNMANEYLEQDKVLRDKGLPELFGDSDIGSMYYILGTMYEEGKGTRQNYEKAKEYYGKVCDLGDQEGCDKFSHLNSMSYR